MGRLGPRRGRASIGSSHLRRARLCIKERRGSGTHHCGCGAARLGARRWKDRKPPLGRIPRIGPTLGEGRPMLGLSISGFERTRFSLPAAPFPFRFEMRVSRAVQRDTSSLIAEMPRVRGIRLCGSVGPGLRGLSQAARSHVLLPSTLRAGTCVCLRSCKRLGVPWCGPFRTHRVIPPLVLHCAFSLLGFSLRGPAVFTRSPLSRLLLYSHGLVYRSC